MNQNTIVIILVSVGVLLLFSFLGASKAKKEGFNNNDSSIKPSKYELIYNQELHTTNEPKEYVKNKTDEDNLREVYQKVIKLIEAEIVKIDAEPKHSLKEFISDFPEFKNAPESEQIKQMKRISKDILIKQKEAFAKLEKRIPGKYYYYSLAFGKPYTIEEMKETENKIEQEIRKKKEQFDKEFDDRDREKHYKKKNERENYNYDKYKKSYDNYDHFSKTSAPTVFYGPNGTKALVMNKNDKFEIIITESNGKTKTYSTSKSNGNNSNNSNSNSNSNENKNTGSAESISRMMKQFENSTFYGPDGGSARFFTGKDGQNAVEETKANGDTTIYTSTNTYTFNYKDKNKAYDNSGSKSKSDSLEYSNDKKGGQNKTSASEVTKGNIPHGKEDLYILKSQIVPPVCPVCPTAAMCADKIKAKCPPCPACARCPESNFDCKKVPSYYSSSESRNPYSSYGRGGFDATGSFNGSSSNMPVPVMSDFSTFGM
jgi:hypothetical protein